MRLAHATHPGQRRHAALSEDRGRALGDGLRGGRDRRWSGCECRRTCPRARIHGDERAQRLGSERQHLLGGFPDPGHVPPGTYVVTIEDDAYDASDPVHMFQLARAWPSTS